MADEQQPSDEQSPFSGFEQEPIREQHGASARGFRIRPEHGLLAAALIAVIAVVGVGAGSLGGGAGGADPSIRPPAFEPPPASQAPPDSQIPRADSREQAVAQCQLLFLRTAAPERPFRSLALCVALVERLHARVYRRCRLGGGSNCASKAEQAVTFYLDCRVSLDYSDEQCRSVAGDE
jgi:hypothetical protein